MCTFWMAFELRKNFQIFQEWLHLQKEDIILGGRKIPTACPMLRTFLFPQTDNWREILVSELNRKDFKKRYLQTRTGEREGSFVIKQAKCPKATPNTVLTCPLSSIDHSRTGQAGGDRTGGKPCLRRVCLPASGSNLVLMCPVATLKCGGVGRPTTPEPMDRLVVQHNIISKVCPHMVF